MYIISSNFSECTDADCQYLFSVYPQGFIYLNTGGQNERLHPPVYLVIRLWHFIMLWPME